MDIPTCFEQQEWAEWLAQAKESGLENPEDSYCLDCTEHFQFEMLEKGRCMRPFTTFWKEQDEDGEWAVVGVW